MKKVYLSLFLLITLTFFTGCNQNTSENLSPSPSVSTSPIPEAEVLGATAQKEFTIEITKEGFSLRELEVKPQDTVTINLVNLEGTHNFVIDELAIESSELSPGQTETITFTVPQDLSGKQLQYYSSLSSPLENDVIGVIRVN